MKKLTALILALLLACGTITGCEKGNSGEETTKNNNKLAETKVVETKAPETKVGDTEVPETNPENKSESVSECLSIQGQKYPYDDVDILILEVENPTDTHYTAIIKVTFYDETGKTMGTQVRKIQELPAGNKQNCLFQPNRQFASYTWEVSSLEEYTGTVCLNTLTTEKYSTEVTRRTNTPTGSGTEFRAMFFIPVKFRFGPYTDIPEGNVLKTEWNMVVFDNTGKVYTIVRSLQNHFNTEGVAARGDDEIILESYEDPYLPMPDELKGDVSVIMCLVGYELWDRTDR